jgi:hypothetical protein
LNDAGLLIWYVIYCYVDVNVLIDFLYKPYRSICDRNDHRHIFHPHHTDYQSKLIEKLKCPTRCHLKQDFYLSIRKRNMLINANWEATQQAKFSQTNLACFRWIIIYWLSIYFGGPPYIPLNSIVWLAKKNSQYANSLITFSLYIALLIRII